MFDLVFYKLSLLEQWNMQVSRRNKCNIQDQWSSPLHLHSVFATHKYGVLVDTGCWGVQGDSK